MTAGTHLGYSLVHVAFHSKAGPHSSYHSQRGRYHYGGGSLKSRQGFGVHFLVERESGFAPHVGSRFYRCWTFKSAPHSRFLVQQGGESSYAMNKTSGRRSRETRSRIIKAALGVIVDHGESRVTMTEVCQRAGISRTTMYRHYRRFEEIIEDVYLEVRESFAAGLRSAIDKDPACEHRLDVVVAYLYTFFQSGLIQTLAKVGPEFLRDLSLKNFDSRVDLYQSSLEPFFDLAEKEKGSPVDRALVAYFITHFYASLSIYATYGKPYEVDVLLKRLICGLTFQK